ncbi:MAG: hypothetical protein HPY45_08250 [Anaerolineae bacterium]|nr:hypothetical protein [Anaerolineae bacterium]
MWNLYQLAKRMGVPVWELAERPAHWAEWGRFFEEIECEIRNTDRGQEAEK